MTNPLLQKYEELYGKKEPPKMPHIEAYEIVNLREWTEL